MYENKRNVNEIINDPYDLPAVTLVTTATPTSKVAPANHVTAAVTSTSGTPRHVTRSTASASSVRTIPPESGVSGVRSGSGETRSTSRTASVSAYPLFQATFQYYFAFWSSEIFGRLVWDF